MNGKVRKVPRNIFHILRSPIAIKAMPSIFRELFVQRRPTSIEDESVKDFFLRHFGSYVTDKFVAPLVVGIYGGNISKLSAQMCFNSLWQLDQKNGSLLRGFFVRSVFKSLREFDDMGQQSAVSLLKNIRSKGGIFSFTRGLQMLTDALASHYRANLRLSSNVVQLRTNDHRQLEVVIEKNEPDGSSHLETLVADYAISCLPANELALVLRSAHPEISELLIKIPFVSIAVVSLGYSENVIPSSLKGFGYLVPPSERQEILGVTFDSEVFPSLFRSSLVSPSTITVMLGGDLDNHDRVIDVTKTSEKELLDISLRYVRQHLGITKTPVCIQIKVCKEAIPQYTVGHTQRLNAIKKLLQHQLPQLYLAGNSYDGVGVGDCVMSASVAAKNIVNSFFEHQK
jgi:oxygen-dependent protoporphyrinogen oxidase